MPHPLGAAGGNFTLNANGEISNSTSGNTFLFATNGNFTMLTSPGTFVGDPEIVNNASTGTVTLGAGGFGHTLTIDSTGTTAVKSNNGNITLSGDSIVINKAVNAGTARITLTNASPGRAINLGSGNTPAALGLTQAELNLLTAGVIQVGSNTAGNITIVSPITNPTNSNILVLQNNGSITQTALGSLQANNLAISSTGPVTLTNPVNALQTVAVIATNGVAIENGTHQLKVGTVDGLNGIFSGIGPISLTADSLNITQQVTAASGIVTLAPFSASQAIVLGGISAAGTLGLSDAELGQISASVLRVDGNVTNDTSNIAVGGAITRHAGYNTLSLSSFGNLTQTAALSVANLALSFDTGITMTTAGNSIDTLAFANVFSGVSITDGTGIALTIGAVDGLTSSYNTGSTTTISTGGNLTLAAGIYSAGTATLTSTNGFIQDGANGQIVNVTAPTLVLSAKTGIGAAGDLLQTQVGTLNAVTSTGGIFINNGSATNVTLNVGTGAGGVEVTGASGDIVLTNNGTIDSTHIGDNIAGPGNITVKALGGSADLNISGQTSIFSVRNTGAGLIDLEAGRDITLGGTTTNSLGAIEAAGSGSIFLQAGRNFTLNPNAYLEVGVGATETITAIAGGDFSMLTSPAGVSNAPFFSAIGGSIALSAGAQHTMTLASTGTNAVVSNGGNITLTADNLFVNAGVNAGAGKVLIQPVTKGQLLSLGAATGGLQLTSALLNEITAKTLTVGSANAGETTLAGPINPLHVTNLTVNTGSGFVANSGSAINIGTGVLTIGFDEDGLGATVDVHSATLTAGTVNLIGGSGKDRFVFDPGQVTTVSGFHLGDTVDLVNTVANGFSFAGGTLTATANGSTVATIGFSGTLAASNFELSSDGNGGTNISFADLPVSDFNGDGKSDLIFQNASNQFLVSTSSSTSATPSFVAPQQWTAEGGPVMSGEARYADINGDGKIDLIYQGTDNRFFSLLSNGDGTFAPGQLASAEGGPFMAGEAQYADVNGDGKADLIYQGVGNRFFVSLSNGNGTFGQGQLWASEPGNFTFGDAQYADINGDGKADLIFQNSNNQVYASLSTGSSFGAPQLVDSFGGSFMAGSLHI